MRRLLIATILLVAALAPAAGAAPPPAERAQDDGSFTETKTLSRIHLTADGAEQTVFENTVTVTADHTTELRGRERVHIAWTGARPSGGRASNPFGESGLTQEYPVVVLQCRGLDDPDAPETKRLSPETCWTTTSVQRSAVGPHRTAVWRHDRYQTEAGRMDRSGADPFPESECAVPSTAVFSARITPFIAADGTRYLGCDAAHMPPEAAVDASFPPAEISAFTDAEGSGAADFEVRSDAENASLGCSNTVECAIVVIPIMGLSCDDGDVECRRNGSFIPGSSNFENAEVQAAVSPRYWWSESNWRNRFTIPISFGPPPDTCEVLDPRPPVGFYGSELLSQAALQWAPAYCLNKQRFKFQHNAMPDAAGFNLMASGGAAAALVSGPQPRSSSASIGFAPTAVTGFAIGYIIDTPENGGEYGRLKLNGRLIAKLLTQSYPGSTLGLGHPGMEGNPLSINLDPEFVKLNPGLDSVGREAAATLLSLSNSSDVIETLTSYIANDPKASAFVDGKPDQWGMKVNPSYKGIKLPRREWPLLDVYQPPAQPGTCRYVNNDAPYLSQVAAPVTTLRKVSDALIDAWPNVQTTCEGPLAGGTYKTGRVARQPFGRRFMMGVVSLGDAARFGLRSAALETSPNAYVAPTAASLARGVEISRQTKKDGPFELDQREVRKDGRAYPGTMVVYTAARLDGLDKDDAKTVASFVRIATTEGQKPGRSNGELPEGFLPIRDSGATAKLFESAQEVATAIESQGQSKPGPTDKPTGKPSDSGDGTPDGGTVSPPVTAPTGDEPSAAPSPSASPSAAPVATPMPATQAVGSDLAGGLLPVLILLGIVGCAATVVIRVATPFFRGRR